MTTRAEYESADYEVIETDGTFEIREYPDLMLASTDAAIDSQGRDGSFMRLFQYISGSNEAKQSISMTTPVFMHGDIDMAHVSMGFVMPKSVAEKGIPKPKNDGVKIRERKGGRFAVIRFAGRLDWKLAKENEETLRKWIASHGIEADAVAETAGYDPPFTPGFLRRNEVLIRLKADPTEPTNDVSNAPPKNGLSEEPNSWSKQNLIVGKSKFFTTAIVLYAFER